MSVQKKRNPDGSVRWYAVSYLGSVDGKKRYDWGKAYPTKQQALDSDAKNRLTRRRSTSAATFREQRLTRSLLERWKEHLHGKVLIGKLAPLTLQRYLDIVDNRIIPDFGQIPCDNRHLTVEVIERQRTKWVESGQWSLLTVKHFLVVFGTALQWVYKSAPGHLEYNPMRLVDKPEPDKRPSTILDLGDARRLLEAADPTNMYDQAITFAALVGSRQGEQCGLLKTDVNWKRRQFVVSQTVNWLRKHVHPDGVYGFHFRKRAKNRASQEPRPLSTPALDCLRRAERIQDEQRVLAGSAWTEYGLVFTDELGRPLDPKAMLKRFRRLLVQLDIAIERPGEQNLVLRVRVHDLRHGVATYQLGDGTPDKDVAANLGHADANMVRRTYGHAVPAIQHLAADRLGELLMPAADEVADASQ